MAKKLFIIRKYVMANNAKQALSLEKNIKADDCWIDDEWKKNNEFLVPSSSEKGIGFKKESK